MQPLNAPSNHILPEMWRTSLLISLIVFLNIQSDGFLLGRNYQSDGFQLSLLPFTLLFLVLLFGLLFAERASKFKEKSRILTFFSLRTQLSLLALFILLSGGFFFAETNKYAAIGYRLHVIPTIAIFFFAFALITLVAYRSDATITRSIVDSDRSLLLFVLLVYTSVYILSIWSFPLSTRRSDMLPLIKAAGNVFLDHQDPYRLYLLPESDREIFLTYLPGTVLAFLPANILQIDLRYLNIFFMVALCVLTYKTTSFEHHRKVIVLLALFLLSPYLSYRHEIYTEPHWLLIVGSILLLQRNRIFWSAAVFGISIGFSQFSWILFPFFLLYLFQHTGLKKALLAAIISSTVAVICLGPFIVWSPHDFFYGVIFQWNTKILEPNTRPINLSWFASELVGINHLQILQGSLLLLIFIYCLIYRTCDSLAGTLRWMAVALTMFILFNKLVWGYFFLLLELLLILYVISANGWLKQPTNSVDLAKTSTSQ